MPSETDPALYLRRWAQRMRAEGLAERTVTEWPAIVRRCCVWLDAHPLRLTTDQLIDYLAQLPSAGTRQTYYTGLKAWHRWLVDTGLRADDPMARLRRPRAPKGEPHPVATGHLDLVLESGIRRRTVAAALLASYQGLRVHEIVKVRGEDVDPIGMRLRVVGKGGTERWQGLHPVIAALADDFPGRGWWFPSSAHPDRHILRASLSATLSRAMKRAGVPGTAHSLRHWTGTELTKAGVSTRVVQEVLRHESASTTQIYVKVAEDQQRQALLTLPLVTRARALLPTPRTPEETR